MDSITLASRDKGHELGKAQPASVRGKQVGEGQEAFHPLPSHAGLLEVTACE